MTTKKSKKSERKVIVFLKKYWWALILVVGLLGCLGYLAVSNYLLQQSFATTHQQLNKAYNSLQDSSQATNTNSDSITKTCKKNWYGFVSEIECGIDVVVHISADIQVFSKEIIENSLRQADFKNIKLTSSVRDNNAVGVGSFISLNSMPCSVYWGPENRTSSKPIIDLYCREVVPNFLPGYARE